MTASALPTLFIKPGCPWCTEARNVLDAAGQKVTELDVTRDANALARMRTLSGQTKVPVLDWHGDILADFGADELRPFLRQHGIAVA